MKIGIVTLCNSINNYGQILQCYALQEYLRGLGHSPYLIRYYLKYIPIGSHSRQLILNKIRRNLSIKQIWYILSGERAAQKEIITSESRRKKALNMQREFITFRDDYIKVSDIQYSTVEEIRENPPLADAYICGSDQIWGGLYDYKEFEVQLLDFGAVETKRIAYAASMGGDTLSGNNKRLFGESLRRFDAVGVREQSLKELCDSVGYINSKVVLDPTLLLPYENYLSLCEDVSTHIDRPYIFFYILNVSCKEDIYWSNINRYIVDKGVDTKVVYSSGYIDCQDILPNITGLQATVPEWISYINNADSVITTSFHGVVFCVKLNRPFLAVLLQGKYSGGNNRIVDLLDKLSLSDRIFDPTILVEKQMDRVINWSLVNHRLDQLTKESCKFIESALK